MKKLLILLVHLMVVMSLFSCDSIKSSMNRIMTETGPQMDSVIISYYHTQQMSEVETDKLAKDNSSSSSVWDNLTSALNVTSKVTYAVNYPRYFIAKVLPESFTKSIIAQCIMFSLILLCFYFIFAFGLFNRLRLWWFTRKLHRCYKKIDKYLSKSKKAKSEEKIKKFEGKCMEEWSKLERVEDSYIKSNTPRPPEKDNTIYILCLMTILEALYILFFGFTFPIFSPIYVGTLFALINYLCFVIATFTQIASVVSFSTPSSDSLEYFNQQGRPYDKESVGSPNIALKATIIIMILRVFMPLSSGILDVILIICTIVALRRMAKFPPLRDKNKNKAVFITMALAPIIISQIFNISAVVLVGVVVGIAVLLSILKMSGNIVISNAISEEAKEVSRNRNVSYDMARIEIVERWRKEGYEVPF